MWQQQQQQQQQKERGWCSNLIIQQWNDTNTPNTACQKSKEKWRGGTDAYVEIMTVYALSMFSLEMYQCLRKQHSRQISSICSQSGEDNNQQTFPQVLHLWCRGVLMHSVKTGHRLQSVQHLTQKIMKSIIRITLKRIWKPNNFYRELTVLSVIQFLSYMHSSQHPRGRIHGFITRRRNSRVMIRQKDARGHSSDTELQ